MGLTQQQFAAKLGYTPKQIQAYVRGANLSARFIQAVEENFPEININYIRNREDNMLVEDSIGLQVNDYGSYTDKDRLIEQMKGRILDRDKLIKSLEDQIQMYKNQLDDCTDKSKRACG